MSNTEATIKTQLGMMAKTWGLNREGYAFLPWIPGDCKDKTERRKNYHEGPAFFWPRDQEKIKAHLAKHQNDDVYWCPSLFERNRRVEGYAVPELALWADLDEVNPTDINDSFRPTLAWQTSPGHYQAIWILTKELVGASWAGRENHRLTAYLGADPSGWDTTQLLRVPGWKNHKPEYRKKYGGPAPGKILWRAGERFDSEAFKSLPEIQTLALDESVMDEEVEAVDRHEVWGKVRLKVTKRVREFMTAREATGDRSEILWEIERELADAGCTLSEIVAIVRGTVWNKYRGRNDELKRLRVEAAKAIQAREDDADTLEIVDDEPKPDDVPTLATIALNIKRPVWQVDQVWRRGVCGFIAGDPKSYKSWIALDLAMSVASGEPFLNAFNVKYPGPVILIEEEDQDNEVIVRSQAIANGRRRTLDPLGAMTCQNNNIFWHPPDDIPLYPYIGRQVIISDPGWQEWLSDKVRELNATMVIIDTFGTTAGDVDVDRSDIMRQALTPLKTISHNNDCSLAIVHHNRKSGDAMGGRRMLGSHHLYGWTEDALFFDPPSKGTVRIHRDSKAARLHDLVLEVPRMMHLERGGAIWAPELVREDRESDPGGSTKAGGADNARESTAPAVVGRMIAAGLAPGQMVSVSHLCELTKMKRNTAYSQLKRATKEGWLKFGKVDGTHVWGLDDS